MPPLKMKIQNNTAATILLIASAMILFDIFRASVGALSLIALSGFEIFILVELMLLFALLLMSFWLFKRAGMRYSTLCLIFSAWVCAGGVVHSVVDRTGTAIAQHWNSEVSQLLKNGHAEGILNVEWDAVSLSSKNCHILRKKQIGMFPELLEYEAECEGLDKRVIVRLSINHRSGMARAYVMRRD